MRSRFIRAIAVVTILFSPSPAFSLAQNNPGDLYQRATMLDESNQNLSEAIRLYSQVAAQSKHNRPLAAWAQYRVGVLYERLGRKAQAVLAYKVVVTRYPDQVDTAERARRRLAAANGKKEPQFVVKKSGPSPDGRFLATFTFPAHQTFYDLSAPAIDSMRHRLYVVNRWIRPLGKDAASKRAVQRGLQELYEPSTLVVLDTEANSVVKTVLLPTFVGSPVFNRADHKLYGNALADGHVRVIDTTTFGQTTIPLEGYPGAIAVNPMTNRVYVASQGFSGNDKLFVIDQATNAVLVRLDLEGVTGGELVFNSATNRLYAMTNDPEKTRVFNCSDNSLVTDLPGIIVMGVDAMRNKLYAALTNEFGKRIGFAVLDGNTHEVVAKVGTTPALVGVNPTTGRVYVAHQYRKEVSIIDANTNNEISRVSFPDVLRYIHVDPTTGRIYVSWGNPPVLGVIEKDSLEEEAPDEFSDDFAGQVLDPAWTVVKGQGHHSLSENPGCLRFRVGGNHARAGLATVSKVSRRTLDSRDESLLLYRDFRLTKGVGAHRGFRQPAAEARSVGERFLCGPCRRWALSSRMERLLPRHDRCGVP